MSKRSVYERGYIYDLERQERARGMQLTESGYCHYPARLDLDRSGETAGMFKIERKGGKKREIFSDKVNHRAVERIL